MNVQEDITVNEPLVSIITPSYNQGRFIRKTIESVLNQDYEFIEYIIVDGGSDDNTLEVLEEYKNRITIISEPDKGQSDAINKGFRMAKGEIVAWLNSDDVYEKGCISRVVREFQKNRNIALVYGDGYILDEAGWKIKKFEHTQEFDLWKLVNFWDYIMQPATFFSKEYLRQVGYLDIDLHYCMDWDLWIKLANVGEVQYIEECLACSREYSETKTSTGGKKRLKEIEYLLRAYSGKKVPLGVFSYRASSLFIKYADKKSLSKFLGTCLNIIHVFLSYYIPQQNLEGLSGRILEFCVPAFCKRCSFEIDRSGLAKWGNLYVSIDGEQYAILGKGEKYIELELIHSQKVHTIRVRSYFDFFWRKRNLKIFNIKLN